MIHPCKTCQYGLKSFTDDGKLLGWACGFAPGQAWAVNEDFDCELWEPHKEAEYNRAMYLLKNSGVGGIYDEFRSLSDAVRQLLEHCKESNIEFTGAELDLIYDALLLARSFWVRGYTEKINSILQKIREEREEESDGTSNGDL